MKIKIFLIFIFLLISNNSLASIRIGIDCANLVNQLDGLSKINLLWLESLNEKKYQLALINKKKNSFDGNFYLCLNKHNINTTSDKTLTVLSERNLEYITTNSIELFTEIFSLTSKESRKYIMQTLNLDDFDITRNELNQAYIAGLMKLNEKLNPTKEIKKEEIKKPEKKLVKKVENNEKERLINEINNLDTGDYYFFGHSSGGKKYTGSTKAATNILQVGKVYSTDNIVCYVRSEQKTLNPPFNGSFILKCPEDKIEGSWQQQSLSSPGIGQGFSDKGDVIAAFFSRHKNVLVEIVNKYFDQKLDKIDNTPTQKIITQKINKDNTPPKIIIANNLTFKNSSYKLEGKVVDEGSKNIYVEIDGIIQDAKNGKFVFERFSPVDEQVKIVAIDQWGNRSKEKIVNIKIERNLKSAQKKIEKLNPSSKVYNHLSSDKVAIIIGIEKYDRTPTATYANDDAKYFYEYARLGFGIPSENIKLLIDKDANLIQSLGVLNKWLPAKINKNQTELIVFFAGHGLASNNGEDLFLLPQDSDPDLLQRTALSRNELFESIIKLKPKNVTMFFDTCYSGISRDEKTLLASARPVRIISNNEEEIPSNFTIFSASKLDQISSGLKEAKHGIFSYFLMKGLEGKADSNKDNKITNGELLAYMNENVSQKASELGREQNPSLAGDPDKILISYR